jgi:hypothetical protein
MLASTETRQACRSLCSSEAADLYAIDVEATMCVHVCVIATIRSINDDIPNQVTNIELLQSLPSSTQCGYPSHDYTDCLCSNRRVRHKGSKEPDSVKISCLTPNSMKTTHAA